MDPSNCPAFLPLTRLEMRCLQLVAEGRCDTSIGRELEISQEEVALVMSVVMKKLSVPNRLACVAKGIYLGLVEIE